MNVRKINCHVYREANQFKIRFIEMEEDIPSPLAAIARNIPYAHVERQIETAFEPEDEDHGLGHIDPMLMFLMGRRENPELRQYIKDNIGDMTPEEYKPILTKQLKDLSYQLNSRLHETLISSYARFNRQKWQDVLHANALSEDDEHNQVEAVTIQTFPVVTYKYFDHHFLLPSDPANLLKFLGMLDGALHSEDHHAPRHGFEVKTYHFEHAPQHDTPYDIVYDAFRICAAEPAKRELSVVIANLIVSQYKQDPEGLAAYKEVVEVLEGFLADKPASLTKLIRDKLYPNPKIEKFLEEQCKDEPVMASMLNPNESYVNASQQVITKLRAQLRTKPNKDEVQVAEAAPVPTELVAVAEPKHKRAFTFRIENEAGVVDAGANEVAGNEFVIVVDADDDELDGFDVIDELDEVELNGVAIDDLMPADQGLANDKAEKAPSRTFKHPVHKEITDWFGKFDLLRKQLWIQFVETLYGHLADDEGYYSSNYTEVRLMKEASMHLNQHGLMELDISKKPKSSYADNYAEGQQNHDILERELRMAFDLLGLHFLPEGEIDFHKGPIVFDAESTRELMNRGMHYTEDYCKQLMRSNYRNRLFEPNNKGQGNQPIQLLPADPKSIISHHAQPDLHPTEDKAVRTMKLA